LELPLPIETSDGYPIETSDGYPLFTFIIYIGHDYPLSAEFTKNVSTVEFSKNVFTAEVDQ